MPDSQVSQGANQLLSKSQVAERYQCSTRTVDRLRKDDDFPAPLKIGNLMPMADEAYPRMGSVEGSIGCVVSLSLKP